MSENIYINLVEELKTHIILQNMKLEDMIYRISMQADLKRVQEYGSSRLGLSDKPWDKMAQFQPFSPEVQSMLEHRKVSTIRHDQVVIGSEWLDLLEDSQYENSTLKHKLTIYERPFFTLYHKSMLLELGHEESENNQGRHYLFLENPLTALHSLWQIHEINSTYCLEQIQ